ncbi:MAG: ABC transporter ATP-binding protein [Acidobacteriota bacterium]|nr:ABC transporter ATP-binding protein [Acidobacteriota bacterium]
MALIEFENVSKTFKQGTGAKLLLRHMQEKVQRREHNLFFALRGVSFKLDRGESLAIIGRNGAGKSTLLSLVAGLALPNQGRVSVDGRVAALLELGSGFHGDLTGIENLWLNASLLGLTRKRTAQVFDSVIDFSGIGEFIFQPLRTYSTGMVMRLAFAVAVHVDPDILIVDEVLAVGDAVFYQKCLDKIMEFRHAGKTLLFVSHAPAMLHSLCGRALWLEQGQVVEDGRIDEVAGRYAARYESHPRLDGV